MTDHERRDNVIEDVLEDTPGVGTGGDGGASGADPIDLEETLARLHGETPEELRRRREGSDRGQ